MSISSSASTSFFSNQASSQSSYEQQSSSIAKESGKSGVVQAWKPVKPTCRFLVKGGGVDDCGSEYEMGYEEKFHDVYVDYARKVNVQPSELCLVHHNQIIDPNSSPFDNHFDSREVVLAYDEDLVTPLCVKVNHSWNEDIRVFTIHDMVDNNRNERHRMNKSVQVKSLYDSWAFKRGVTGDDVTLFLRGKSLEVYAQKKGATLEDAGIVDGTTPYGRWET